MTDPIRFSNLKRMADSPAHYRASIANAWEPTLSMRLGTIVDRAIFGGPLQVYDGATRTGKAWEAFKAASSDPSEIVTAKEVEKAQPMIRALRSDADAMDLLSGTTQKHLIWEYMGRACSSRPDAFDLGKRRVVDLKTTRTSRPGWFMRDAIRMSYHAQLAFYGMALGLDASDGHYLVAVESQEPYCVVRFRLTERAVLAGRKLCALWMGRLMVCEDAHEWPGYAQNEIEFDVPDELDLDFGDDDADETETNEQEAA